MSTMSPLTITTADLTVIKAALTARAQWYHVQAANARPLNRDQFVQMAREREELAARLSFAVPGQPIHVQAGEG